jgi:16S rRNA (cytosine1402-N4)-methyltransferase
MMGNGEANSNAGGGPARHIPVLLADALEALDIKPGGLYLDGTFGAGGYARAILEAAPGVRLIGLDRDPDAIRDSAALVARSDGRLQIVDSTFSQMDQVITDLDCGLLDGVVLDIGVSSMQLDQAIRGFSFRNDGPLDMRMAQSGQSAADIVNDDDEARIADIIYNYGEERRSRAIARKIVEKRIDTPITTTRMLADIVASVIRPEPHKAHPATRTFQALRIAVNDELGELVRALHAAERILKPGGRLVVVTFHSLEDRIVKQFFAARTGRAPTGSRHMPMSQQVAPTFAMIGKMPVLPSEEETRLNPRARSAKLRACERTGAAALPIDPDLMALATLPEPRKPYKAGSSKKPDAARKKGSSR